MDDITSGVIDDAPLVEEATTPKTESANSVGEDEPKGHKGHPCLNVHPTKNGPSKQDKRNGRKSELKVDKRGHGIKRLAAGLGHSRLADEVLLAQSWGTLPPKRQELVTKGHAVAHKNPANEDGREGVEGHES